MVDDSRPRHSLDKKALLDIVSGKIEKTKLGKKTNMKKQLFTLIASMAIVAQAAQIDWGNLSTDYLLKDKNGAAFTRGTTGTAVSSGLTAYFINETYLGNILMDSDDLVDIIAGGGDISGYASKTLSGSSMIAFTAGVLSGASFGFTHPNNNTTPSSPTLANKDDVFFVLLTATFGSEKYYQIITSPTDWKSAIAADGAPTQAFSWANAAATPWTPVPEPLTVGLALAGVALLIAQRKRK